MSFTDTKSESVWSATSRRLQDLERTIEFKKSSAGIGFRVQSIMCSLSHDCCKQGVIPYFTQILLLALYFGDR